MIKFVNRLTGVEMWVADDRAEEYKAAGHKPAAHPKPEDEAPKAPAQKKTKKKV